MAIEFGEKKNDVVEVFRGKTFAGHIIVLTNDAIYNGNSIDEIEQILSKMKELRSDGQNSQSDADLLCQRIYTR